MIYISDLQQLIEQWLGRIGNPTQPQAYKDALNECIYDLNKVVDKAIEDDFDYKEAIESWEADNFLSSMEAHEAVA